MALHIILGVCLIDVIIAYLYESFDVHIYMKVPLGLETTSQVVSILDKYRGIKLLRALYGFK